MCRHHTTESADSCILILSPSHGLGGGIERYAETVQLAFATTGRRTRRFDLRGPMRVSRLMSHLQIYARCSAALKSESARSHLIVLHRTLLPVAWLLARRRLICGLTVVCHGNEIWRRRLSVRNFLEDRILRSSSVQIVAVSSYTAGALAGKGPVRVLPPGLSVAWFNTLIQAAANPRNYSDDIRIVTAFRLSQWRDKGLRQILEAIGGLGMANVRLSICGVGPTPPDVAELIRAYPWCELNVDLPPSELARQFAEADLMVLATQARFGRNAYCESYGLVLAEAQVAGTGVVAPAFGGSRDAFITQRTGIMPTGQGPEELRAVLTDLVSDRMRLTEMGTEAAIWARSAFGPLEYARRAANVLL